MWKDQGQCLEAENFSLLLKGTGMQAHSLQDVNTSTVCSWQSMSSVEGGHVEFPKTMCRRLRMGRLFPSQALLKPLAKHQPSSTAACISCLRQKIYRAMETFAVCPLGLPCTAVQQMPLSHLPCRCRLMFHLVCQCPAFGFHAEIGLRQGHAMHNVHDYDGQ